MSELPPIDHIPDSEWLARNAPPKYVIAAAVAEANKSPCAKSRRGAIAFSSTEADRFGKAAFGVEFFDYADRERCVIVGRGFNGQPPPFVCIGKTTCGIRCASLCMHAEQRALIAAAWRANKQDSVELVHAKSVDGKLVAGKTSCCMECSRMALDMKIAGVWLYESTDIACERHADDPLCTCGARGDIIVPGYREIVLHGPDCPSMAYFSTWKFYTAIEFHRAAMIADGASFTEKHVVGDVVGYVQQSAGDS